MLTIWIWRYFRENLNRIQILLSQLGGSRVNTFISKLQKQTEDKGNQFINLKSNWHNKNYSIFSKTFCIYIGIILLTDKSFNTNYDAWT